MDKKKRATDIKAYKKRTTATENKHPNTRAWILEKTIDLFLNHILELETFKLLRRILLMQKVFYW